MTSDEENCPIAVGVWFVRRSELRDEIDAEVRRSARAERASA